MPKLIPKPISLVHPTGNPNVRNVALALAEASLLHEVITTLAINPTGRWVRWLRRLPGGDRLSAELGRRDWRLPLEVSICSYPWQEVGRILLERTGIRQRLGWSAQSLADRLYVFLDRQVARRHLAGIQAIYAYEDGAAATFMRAKQAGIVCIYELPIAFYRTSQTIQQEEADRFPQFAKALVAAREPSWKIERKYQELQLADRIIVPSRFVLTSVTNEGIPLERITVIPYGAPIDYFQPQPKPDSTFRALFVGRVGPRKGVHYLLEAWRSLQLVNAELMMVGINEFPCDWFSRHADYIRYLPSVPHASLQEYYSQASVLVLPSLVEGMSLVLLEAMACGIPLITTPNAAGLDLITDGVEGFIVPIRDVDALKTRLEWCYQHPEQLAAMGRNARRKAEELTWQLYRDRIQQTVMAALS